MYTGYVFSFTGHCRDRDTYAAVFGSLFISDHALDGASELREAIQNHAYGKMLLFINATRFLSAGKATCDI